MKKERYEKPKSGQSVKAKNSLFPMIFPVFVVGPRPLLGVSDTYKYEYIDEIFSKGEKC